MHLQPPPKSIVYFQNVEQSFEVWISFALLYHFFQLTCQDWHFLRELKPWLAKCRYYSFVYQYLLNLHYYHIKTCTNKPNMTLDYQLIYLCLLIISDNSATVLFLGEIICIKTNIKYYNWCWIFWGALRLITGTWLVLILPKKNSEWLYSCNVTQLHRVVYSSHLEFYFYFFSWLLLYVLLCKEICMVMTAFYLCSVWHCCLCWYKK